MYNSALSHILHQSSIAYQSSNYLEAVLSKAFNESFIDLLGLVLMFSSSGSGGDFGTGSSGLNVHGCDEYPLSVFQLCRVLERQLSR